MPLEEKRAFIKDPQPGMTTEEKNQYLSAKLCVAPYSKMNIVRIERVEIGASGWWIYHRVWSDK